MIDSSIFSLLWNGQDMEAKTLQHRPSCKLASLRQAFHPRKLIAYTYVYSPQTPR
jgi:hypothetical protein